MSTSTTIKTSADPSSSTSNDRPFVQWQLSSEENDNEPTTTSDTSATVSSKSSVRKNFDSDKEDRFDSVSPKKIKSSDRHRPVCQYGASCYRQNPQDKRDYKYRIQCFLLPITSSMI